MQTQENLSQSPGPINSWSSCLWTVGMEWSSKPGCGRPSHLHLALHSPRLFEYCLNFCDSLPPGNCPCTLVQGGLCPGADAGLCKPRSCTHVWSTCSFPGLCVIKNIKRSGVETEPAKGWGPFARNWWCKCSPQLVVICKAANINKN